MRDPSQINQAPRMEIRRHFSNATYYQACIRIVYCLSNTRVKVQGNDDANTADLFVDYLSFSPCVGCAKLMDELAPNVPMRYVVNRWDAGCYKALSGLVYM